MDDNISHEHERTDANAPDYIAWHVTGAGKRGRRKPCWTRIGAAWMHRDGKGYNIQLDLLPASGGRIVLRSPKSGGDADDSESRLIA
jgi:hypothetical protein